MGLSDFHPRPARILADRRLRELSPAHGDGSPVLTREPFARMSTPLPRRLGPVHMSLASRTNFGLRPFGAGSAHALAVSRPARRSLMFQPARSLTPFRGLLHQRLRPGPLPIRAAPAASGWSNCYRVGYLPPTGFSRPFHGARQSRAKYLEEYSFAQKWCWNPLIYGVFHLRMRTNFLPPT